MDSTTGLPISSFYVALAAMVGPQFTRLFRREAIRPAGIASTPGFLPTPLSQQLDDAGVTTGDGGPFIHEVWLVPDNMHMLVSWFPRFNVDDDGNIDAYGSLSAMNWVKEVADALGHVGSEGDGTHNVFLFETLGNVIGTLVDPGGARADAPDHHDAQCVRDELQQ